jgi:hypothetical protein
MDNKFVRFKGVSTEIVLVAHNVSAVLAIFAEITSIYSGLVCKFVLALMVPIDGVIDVSDKVDGILVQGFLLFWSLVFALACLGMQVWFHAERQPESSPI